MVQPRLVSALAAGLILAGTVLPAGSTSGDSLFLPGSASAELVSSAAFAEALGQSVWLLPGGESHPSVAAAAAPAAAMASATIVDFQFLPFTTSVNVGDTVGWTNNGRLQHTSTSDTRVWDSGTLNPGASFSFTFNTAGSFSYFCRFHPFMRGGVNVTAAAEPTPTASPPPTATVPPPTATSSPTARVTATAGPTATAGTATAATATAAPTPGGPVGGRGFTLRTGPGGATALSWTGGTAQTSYVLLRVSAGGAASIPLVGAATSFVDAMGATQPFSCYLLVPMSDSAALGISDLLCVIRNLRSGLAPSDFGIRLDGPRTATLSWTPPGGQDGYVLAPLGRSAVALDGSATSASQPVVGTTCFLLVPTLRGAPIGNTDVVCAVAGVGTLMSAGPG